ncbi:P-loop containing nucleoside triphosphate hydrolase protein, partial [Dissophora ornata]
VIDEAHCIGTGKFRKDCNLLGQLRALVPFTTPFLAVSATLPPSLLSNVTNTLYFKNPRIINVGNDRINIKYKVIQLKNSRTLLQDLDFLNDMVKTIVYFRTMGAAEDTAEIVRTLVGDDKVAVYRSMVSDDTVATCIQKFKNGSIHILVSTDAAGMGCDINDVVRVVQYGYQDNLSSLVQRFGRAARDPSIMGTGILLAPAIAPASVEPVLKE